MTPLVRREAHFSLDLETLGKSPGCAILSIGAVLFDPRDDFYTSVDVVKRLSEKEDAIFYREIDLFTCLLAGLTIDPDTLEFWRKNYRPGLFHSEKVSLEQAVREFYEWVIKQTCDRLSLPVVERTEPKGFGEQLAFWAKSPRFDCAVWEAAVKAVNGRVPWTFRQQEDVRTAHRMGNIDKRAAQLLIFNPDGKHNALIDAAYQARCVNFAYKNINEQEAILTELAERAKATAT